MDTITSLDPADTIARSLGGGHYYDTPTLAPGAGEVLALGHDRRALAAAVAHAREAGADLHTLTVHHRWATFRLPTPDDIGDYDWYFDWDDDEYPTGTAVTMLTAGASS
ncbi:hypothetical protein [Streptomyces sp. MP131-18]|uniref:hypothetical protein n=1 Tax=Streptomyces sp. MP131-18 TaxID=1857892 RepID=UPI00097BBC61|nr:hypothetical protein [Streptomyces sp. MP131-18]ONK09498.1 hypothetical protein STBA_01980 [Streptomyces sp. MP131-18]